MAVLAEILPVVSRSSSLALELYRVAAKSSQDLALDFVKVTGTINEFALILKQIGTIIKEDDRLPSHEAIETLEDVIEQSQHVLAEIESTSSSRDDVHHDKRDSAHSRQGDYFQYNSTATARLDYLTAHLQALRSTLSVLLQTLYTAQSIIWSKLRPTVSPQQAARAVANETTQLETLIIEQQVSILSTLRVHEQAPRPDARLLMEADSSQSLIALERKETPAPASLRRYQDDHIARLDMPHSTEARWLQEICSITSSQAERLLESWTSLPQFDVRLRDAEREVRKQKQENQQPTVESDSEEERGYRSKLAGNGTKPSQKHGDIQPLFSDSTTLPIPVPESKYGPNVPLSPAASPMTSRNTLATPANEQDSPVSPRSSISSLPVEAAAAMEAKDEDDDVDLEIPWTLWTRKYYWKYIDAKQVGSNTDQMSSIAFLERNSWTEIMASWVCKEAIKEAGYRFTQVQKDRQDGRRTKLETCFCIEKPLQFDEVERLVERTVELYRKTAPPTPPPQVIRSSFQQPPSLNIPKTPAPDRDRTPIARNTHPPLERSTSSMRYPPQPPPLDRSISMPGPTGLLPPYPHTQTPSLYVQMPSGPYTPQPQLPPRPQSPRVGTYASQPVTYSPQAMNPNSPQFAYPSSAPLNNNAFIPSHLQPPQLGNAKFPVSQSPLRQSYLNPTSRSKYDDTTTSDSDNGGRERSRRHRSKSRSRHASGKQKKKSSHGTSKAVGALMGVGGLTALLDGLSGL